MLSVKMDNLSSLLTLEEFSGPKSLVQLRKLGNKNLSVESKKKELLKKPRDLLKRKPSLKERERRPPKERLLKKSALPGKLNLNVLPKKRRKRKNVKEKLLKRPKLRRDVKPRKNVNARL